MPDLIAMQDGAGPKRQAGSGQAGTPQSSGRHLYIVAWSVCKVQPGPIAGELVDEGLGDGAILTLLRDKGRDFCDVASRRFAIDKPWHSTRRSLLEAVEVVACI